MASIVLLTAATFAQTKNPTTDIVKIYGNCGMCKTTIEKAGTIKNEANVDWDKDTKMATLIYDSSKTSKEEILKRIALAGYDSDSFLAPNDTYSSLPGCCQYERANTSNAIKNEHNMESMSSNHSEHSDDKIDMNQTNMLTSVFDHYFELKDALVKTDGIAASASSKKMLTSIEDVKMDKLPMDVHMVWMKLLKDLKADAQKIAATKDAGNQRDSFLTLSKNMYELMKVSKQETPTYLQFCPMANKGKGANWLSKDLAIKNPYYGSQMLSCGKTVETFK